MESIFAQGGPLSAAHPAFESRAGQVVMAKAVESALEKRQHLVVQAGTGLGKTFAYLIPTLRFALKEKKRVVISTRTINLQEQIFKKDIPFLQEALGQSHPFVAVLAKGRANYVCLNKMQHLRGLDRGIFTTREQVAELSDLQRLVSSGAARSGDREEISARVSGEVWSHISADGESCLRRACSFYDSCYYYAARRAQVKADLVVVNHALFFADLAIRKESGFEIEQAVLEDYDAVVFDEAHNLEDVATDFFSRSINVVRIRRIAAFVMASFRDGGPLFSPARSEILQSLETLTGHASSMAAVFFSQFDTTKRLAADDIEGADLLDNTLQAWLEAQTALTGSGLSEEENAQLSLLHSSVDALLRDFRFICNRLGEDAFVYWIEVLQGSATLKAAPISLEEDLRDNLFRRTNTIVLTSATLSSVLLKRVGLCDCELLRLESPFNYKANCLLYLPPDARDPRTPDYDQYTAEKVLEIAAVTAGRALILFTSYKAMNAVFDLVTMQNASGYTLLRQGAAQQQELMAKFRDSRRALLFAVASFWEGVDIPGDALSCVILVKLPFSVPTEPIVQARLERIQQEGHDSFSSFSLPQAVLRLKQGFGRLIRTATDKGVVVVLDDRIQTKQYGRAFLRELPPARITDSLEDVRALFCR